MSARRYFFVGMPASGKSKIGKLVADQLDLPFYDLDDYIEDLEQRTITDIFVSEGEEYFRNVEKVSLRHFVSQQKSFVLATGGGAPCFHDNMQSMNRSGVTIFLDVAVQDLFEKLSKKGTKKRPLLNGMTLEALKAELENKHRNRYLYYSQSTICLKQSIGEIHERVNQVLFAINTLEK